MNGSTERSCPRWISREIEVCINPETQGVYTRTLDLAFQGAAVTPPKEYIDVNDDRMISVELLRTDAIAGCRAKIIYMKKDRWGLYFETPIPEDFFPEKKL